MGRSPDLPDTDDICTIQSLALESSNYDMMDNDNIIESVANVIAEASPVAVTANDPQNIMSTVLE